MAGFVRFGFGGTGPNSGGTGGGGSGGGTTTLTGASLAAFLKVNQRVQHMGSGIFHLITATSPIVPESLKVFVNGANQTPDYDFVVIDGYNFKMLDTTIDWASSYYTGSGNIVADFIQN